MSGKSLSLPGSIIKQHHLRCISYPIEWGRSFEAPGRFLISKIGRDNEKAQNNGAQMVVDGSSFLKRARIFFAEMKAGRFPNASTLASLSGCSGNTAQRTIYRLRDEYLVPLEYDSSEKGYYLKNNDFELPETLPPGRDELAALLLSATLLKSLEVEDLKERLESLWTQFAVRNSSVTRELKPLEKVFSCDMTEVSFASDLGALTYATYAAIGQDLKITYKSPWSGNGEKEFRGRIERVHLSDFTLYLLFHRDCNIKTTLNAAFIISCEKLDQHVEIDTSKDLIGGENWLTTFGVFSGTEVEEIELRILPPASRYYATKRWHESQVDSWDGDVLVRRVHAVISPEITRKVLSLGKYVESISPESLRESVREHAEALLGCK